MRATLTFVAALVLAAVSVTAMAADPGPKDKPVINVVASGDQKFDPAVVTMHVGKTQTLHLSSSGGVHGIVSPELGIPATMIVPDKPVTVSVTPKKAGTYKLPCTIVCGANHADMLLTIEVQP